MRCFSGVGSSIKDSRDVDWAAAAATLPVALSHFCARLKNVSSDRQYSESSLARFAISKRIRRQSSAFLVSHKTYCRDSRMQSGARAIREVCSLVARSLGSANGSGSSVFGSVHTHLEHLARIGPFQFFLS